MLHGPFGYILRSCIMPEPLALGALHPAAAGRGLGRGDVRLRPELGLRHGQERRRRHREVVVVLVLVLRLVRRLRGRLVLRGRLERRLERRLLLRLGLRLVRRRQRGVQGPLQVGLCVGGQERLSRAGQEGLPRRDERPRGR